jgi:hypothetical protein
MVSLNGIKELVEIFLDFLPSRRKDATRKRKLEIALLQIQIQKEQMEIRQADYSILNARLERIEKAFEIVDKNFPNISPKLKLVLATKLLASANTQSD